MNVWDKINELIQKKKITDAQSREGALLLFELLSDSSNDTKIAECIMKFKVIGCINFFEEIIARKIEIKRINEIYNAVCSTSEYKNNKNHAATTRGFAIFAVLIKHKSEFANKVLMQTLTFVEKDKFTDPVIKNFNDNVIAYYGDGIINTLNEFKYDNLHEQNRFVRFMQAVVNGFNVTNEVKKTNEAVAEIVIESTELPKAIKSDDKSKLIADELLKTLLSANREVTTLIQALSLENGTIANLRQQIGEQKQRIVELTDTITAREHEIERLQREKSELEQAIHDKEDNINDLAERLTTSRNMNNISQNQELTTLKSKLSNDIKIEYTGYLADKNAECNPDSYEALLASLDRIFKTLRRCGISID